MLIPRRGTATGGVRFGVSLTFDAGRSLSVRLDDLRGRAAVDTVDVDIRLLERALGAPESAMPIEPPPLDGLAFGLLELEEEVLHDSYVLAAATLQSQVREWRTKIDVAAIGPISHTWDAAGLPFGIVTVPDLTTWSGDEQSYACRLASAAGARVVSTAFSQADPARLAPLARRHDLHISFVSDATGVADLARVTAEDTHLAVALDLHTWTLDEQGSLLPFVEAHADRLSHIYLPGSLRVDDGAIAVDVDDASIADVLRALGRRTSPIPVIVVVD